MFMIKKVIL